MTSMKTIHYALEQNEATTQFVFFSEGNRGRVMKAVVLNPYDRHRWNLAFGDVGPDWEIDDRAITNNHDWARVLATVAQAAILFSEAYPNRSFVVFPVDDKRKRLYNWVFKRKITEIQGVFHVLAKRGRRWEAYCPDFEYDAFELLRKIG